MQIPRLKKEVKELKANRTRMKAALEEVCRHSHDHVYSDYVVSTMHRQDHDIRCAVRHVSSWRKSR